MRNFKTYVDYDFYKNEYFGELDENIFNSKNLSATMYLNVITMGKLKNVKDNDVPVEVLFCICELIEAEYKYVDNADKNKIVASESVGKHSKAYTVKVKSVEQEKTYIIKKWLLYTDLLYAGINNCCDGDWI